MSLGQMEEAMTLLLRLPDRNRGEDLPPFLNQYELSDGERKQLEIISGDKEFNKYGKGMASVRAGNVRRFLKFSKYYVGRELTMNLVHKHFDPVALKVGAWRYPLRFLDFVLSDKDVRKTISEIRPPFIFDMFEVERVQLQFRLEETPDQGVIPPGSLLEHSNFVVLDLNYDIFSILPKIPKSKGKWRDADFLPVPEKRPIKVAMVKRQGTPDCRIFEISDDVDQFLKRQLSDPPDVGELPQSYEDLVTIGLCKPVN